MKKSHAYNSEVERSVKVRKAIIDFIRAADHPVTSAELAYRLKETSRSIRNYCLLLKNGKWLATGPIVVMKNRSRRQVLTWIAGTNSNPITHPVRHRKLPPKKERPLDLTITPDDLAWMQKYRDQRAQRYLKRGLEVPAIY